MKWRKGIALLVTASMTLFVAACGGAKETADVSSANPEKTEADAAGGEEEKADHTEVSNAESTEEVKNREEKSEEKKEEKSENAEAEADKTEEKPREDKKGKDEKVATDGNIEETVLLEEDGIKITATGLSYSNYDVKLNLTIENNTEQKLSFTSGTLGYSCNSINGYMTAEGYLNADVAAGKKKNDSISFSYNELLLYGITEIADIQVGFTVKNDDYDIVCQKNGQVQTSLAESYDYETDTLKAMLESKAWEKLADCSVDYYSGEEIYNQDGIRIVSQALITNRDDERVVLIEVVNDLPETVFSSVGDIFLNDLLVATGTWNREAIAPGKRRIIEMTLESMLDKAYWERLGITEVDNITFTFGTKDEEDAEIFEPCEISMAISGESLPLDDSGQELYSEEGMRIIDKGLKMEDSDYWMYMLFLVENQSSNEREVKIEYDSISMNGYMVGGYDYVYVPAGSVTVLEVNIPKDDLEENNIFSIEDITEAELTFEIKEGYKEIASPTVTIQYK